MSDIPVTVVMRSFNDACLLPRTLAALDAQRGVTVSLIVLESASTDESPTILRQHGADHIIDLKPGTYWSSEVLNHGVSLANTEAVALLNSDAVMTGPDCLRLLAEALLSEVDCAGVFARQTVRSEASILTRLDYSTAFDHRHELGAEHVDCLSLVCSMIRRSAWQIEPFDADLTFAEDWAWSKRMQMRGKHIRYVAEAVAEHSHEYTREQAYRRSFGDSAAMAKLIARKPGGWLREVAWPLLRRCLRDTWRLHRLGHLGACWRLPAYRYPQMYGAWRGSKAGWQHFHVSAGGRQPRV